MMSLTGLMLSILFQVGWGFWGAMLAVYAGAGAANATTLSPFQDRLFSAAIFAFPVLSALVILILIYGYRHQFSGAVYWWHALPIGCLMVYISYLSLLSR